MTESILKPLEFLAGSVMDSVAGFFSPTEVTLSAPPSDGTVRLPQDLFATPDVQTEWWYYTGHCHTTRGREFGFELVFFKRRTDLDRIGVVPMTILANPMYFAHFAISDVTARSFRYDHIRSFDRPFDTPVSMSTTACDIRLGDWTLREIAGKHILHATLTDGTVFDAVLESDKPLVLNGDGGSGITKKGAGSSNHFSFTRMRTVGQLSLNGEVDTFSGNAWMDREYGSWGQGDWDWFSLQFDDETELMIYQYKTASGEMNGASTGTFVEADGTCKYLQRSDFAIEPLSTWTSPTTAAEYPASWRVTVPSLEIDITITPLIADQELETRGTTMIVYWEGACAVSGKKAEKDITGRAYVELVGYDRSHETVSITDLLLGRTGRDLKAMFG